MVSCVAYTLSVLFEVAAHAAATAATAQAAAAAAAGPAGVGGSAVAAGEAAVAEQVHGFDERCCARMTLYILSLQGDFHTVYCH